MIEAIKSSNHSIERIDINLSYETTLYKTMFETSFGVVPDWWKEESLTIRYWDMTKKLIDFILNNTDFKLVGVAKNNDSISYFFVN